MKTSNHLGQSSGTEDPPVMNQANPPDISAIITVPWVRGSVLGLRFGTPIPTQVRLCYHSEHGHWLEFSDGSRADVVASRFPEEIRLARLEMMTSFQRRQVITDAYRRRKSEVIAKPSTERESRPQILRPGISQMTSTEAIRRASGATVSPVPVVPPAADPLVADPSAANPFEVFDQFNEPVAPPPPAVTQSSVFAVKTDRTAKRLEALRSARQNPPA
jgi:hypothetical protein